MAITASFAQFGPKYGFQRKILGVSNQSLFCSVSAVQRKVSLDLIRAIIPRKLHSSGYFERMQLNIMENARISGVVEGSGEKDYQKLVNVA